jgi:hypothetical protein
MGIAAEIEGTIKAVLNPAGSRADPPPEHDVDLKAQPAELR